ncbi:MAG: type IIA DNA topoisomerase subunit B, partial [Cyclobacteriaceae bacterium]|nr:type IIA DNA topoisomerase subunit B [Cyclobacteriaceae bacterium]
RNKKETIYCYSDEEKQQAMNKLGSKPEITRFKGLGEISPEEFGNFIGDKIRLQPVRIDKEKHLQKILEFYMGKNTPDRQEFIIDNLRIEMDIVESIPEKEDAEV